MVPTRYRYVLAAALSASACVNPLEPESARLRDPGTVVVTVRDEAGSAVRGVWVYVELPNDIGSFFWEGSPTDADGRVTFRYVPAGVRMVEVKAPTGYAAVGAAKRELTVVRGRTATAQFTLRRS